MYKVVSAVVAYDDRIDSTTIGAKLIADKVNAEMKNGWKIYGSLVVATNVRAKSNDGCTGPYGRYGIGFFQTMVK